MVRESGYEHKEDDEDARSDNAEKRRCESVGDRSVDKVSGCALCERKESSQWHKNTETGDICESCYQKQRAIGMAPPNGCALCEKKESSHWHKNTQTGERDICITCYNKQRRAPPNGCVISVWHWCTNTETGEIDICNTCYRQ